MPKTAKRVQDEIVAYIKKHGGVYADWNAGIASNARARLFRNQKVSKKGAWWIYRTCSSYRVARGVEDALHKLGCDGSSGGGDSSTIKVYAYLKTKSPDP
jgi:siroheme synthase (precorrin-2 oxidase/ferrochelatase)